MSRGFRLTARGVLFLALAAGLLAIGYLSAAAGHWVPGAGGLVLGVWMADLARREVGLVRRH
ncbi:MAG TPA: hypothetical protein VMU66_10405 [Gaiellales bacterium]|nr:hypothetical protein [Gaiellales bacterium]